MISRLLLLLQTDRQMRALLMSALQLLLRLWSVAARRYNDR
jgi:hypothetical protein